MPPPSCPLTSAPLSVVLLAACRTPACLKAACDCLPACQLRMLITPAYSSNVDLQPPTAAARAADASTCPDRDVDGAVSVRDNEDALIADFVRGMHGSRALSQDRPIRFAPFDTSRSGIIQGAAKRPIEKFDDPRLRARVLLELTKRGFYSSANEWYELAVASFDRENAPCETCEWLLEFAMCGEPLVLRSIRAEDVFSSGAGVATMPSEETILNEIDRDRDKQRRALLISVWFRQLLEHVLRRHHQLMRDGAKAGPQARKEARDSEKLWRICHRLIELGCIMSARPGVSEGMQKVWMEYAIAGANRHDASTPPLQTLLTEAPRHGFLVQHIASVLHKLPGRLDNVKALQGCRQFQQYPWASIQPRSEPLWGLNGLEAVVRVCRVPDGRDRPDEYIGYAILSLIDVATSIATVPLLQRSQHASPQPDLSVLCCLMTLVMKHGDFAGEATGVIDAIGGPLTDVIEQITGNEFRPRTPSPAEEYFKLMLEHLFRKCTPSNPVSTVPQTQLLHEMFRPSMGSIMIQNGEWLWNEDIMPLFCASVKDRDLVRVVRKLLAQESPHMTKFLADVLELLTQLVRRFMEQTDPSDAEAEPRDADDAMQHIGDYLCALLEFKPTDQVAAIEQHSALEEERRKAGHLRWRMLTLILRTLVRTPDLLDDISIKLEKMEFPSQRVPALAQVVSKQCTEGIAMLDAYSDCADVATAQKELLITLLHIRLSCHQRSEFNQSDLRMVRAMAGLNETLQSAMLEATTALLTGGAQHTQGLALAMKSLWQIVMSESGEEEFDGRADGLEARAAQVDGQARIQNADAAKQLATFFHTLLKFEASRKHVTSDDDEQEAAQARWQLVVWVLSHAASPPGRQLLASISKECKNQGGVDLLKELVSKHCTSNFMLQTLDIDLSPARPMRAASGQSLSPLVVAIEGPLQSGRQQFERWMRRASVQHRAGIPTITEEACSTEIGSNVADRGNKLLAILLRAVIADGKDTLRCVLEEAILALVRSNIMTVLDLFLRDLEDACMPGESVEDRGLPSAEWMLASYLRLLVEIDENRQHDNWWKHVKRILCLGAKLARQKRRSLNDAILHQLKFGAQPAPGSLLDPTHSRPFERNSTDPGRLGILARRSEACYSIDYGYSSPMMRRGSRTVDSQSPMLLAERPLQPPMLARFRSESAATVSDADDGQAQNLGRRDSLFNALQTSPTPPRRTSVDKPSAPRLRRSSSFMMEPINLLEHESKPRAMESHHRVSSRLHLFNVASHGRSQAGSNLLIVKLKRLIEVYCLREAAMLDDERDLITAQTGFMGALLMLIKTDGEDSNMEELAITATNTFIQGGHIEALHNSLQDRWKRVQEGQMKAADELAMVFRLLMLAMSDQLAEDPESLQNESAHKCWTLIKRILIYASITVRRPINRGDLMRWIITYLQGESEVLGMSWSSRVDKPNAGRALRHVFYVPCSCQKRECTCQMQNGPFLDLREALLQGKLKFTRSEVKSFSVLRFQQLRHPSDADVADVSPALATVIASVGRPPLLEGEIWKEFGEQEPKRFTVQFNDRMTSFKPTLQPFGQRRLRSCFVKKGGRWLTPEHAMRKGILQFSRTLEDAGRTAGVEPHEQRSSPEARGTVDADDDVNVNYQNRASEASVITSEPSGMRMSNVSVTLDADSAMPDPKSALGTSLKAISSTMIITLRILVETYVGRELAELGVQLEARRDLKVGVGFSGLKWTNVGSNQPPAGTELRNDELAKRLSQGQMEFSEAEWASLKVFHLQKDHYVKAVESERYFCPEQLDAVGAEKWEGVQGLENVLQALLTVVVMHDQLLPVMGVISELVFRYNWVLVTSQGPLRQPAMETFTQRWMSSLSVYSNGDSMPSQKRQQAIEMLCADQLSERKGSFIANKFKDNLLASNIIVQRKVFWSEPTFQLLSRAAVETRYPKLNAPNLSDDFYLKLVMMCLKMEALAVQPDEDKVSVVVIDQLLVYLNKYEQALSVVVDLNLVDEVLKRSTQDDWEHQFSRKEKRDEGTENETEITIFFRVENLKEVIEKGLDVYKRVADLEKAKKALFKMLQSYAADLVPLEWSKKFEASSKQAYNLQYMFREDMSMAKQLFQEHLKLCPKAKGEFGDAKKMYGDLLTSALGKYPGLVDQDVLAETNFTEQPEKLLQTVKQSVEGKGPEVELIGELAIRYMEQLIEKKTMPLTPHHTQVLAMLLFSGFLGQQSKFSQPVEEGGYNYNAAIMQMKTGEGKSMVIAMLAVFVVKHWHKRVHVLENNEGLLERDFDTYKPFYDLFTIKREGKERQLTSRKLIDSESDICYCLKKQNNEFFKAELAAGRLDLSGVVLIVDEVDDLVVSEEPTVSYVRTDKEKTPSYEQCFAALSADEEKPAGVDDMIWAECVRAKEEASKKIEYTDYVNTEQNGYEIRINGRTPKLKLSNHWLEYLNYRDHRQTLGPYKKQTFFAAMCTPYMYTKYSCIFGLTGSIGGELEKEYIKQTYRAVAFEVPQFLKTCSGPGKQEARNLGMELTENREQQRDRVVELAGEYYRKVPVLIIARDAVEMTELYDAIQDALLMSSDELLSDGQLLMFREQDEKGILLKDEWSVVVKKSTQAFGEGPDYHCCITVTDFFGGRGHDFSVNDDTANENGGMLVIATSVPDTREWIQWKGRTARQDKPGQYYVVVSKADEPFTNVVENPDGTQTKVLDDNYVRQFENMSHDDRIYGIVPNGLLQKQDQKIQGVLEKYSSSQAKGAWLNELCEKFYKKYPRNLENAEWPSVARKAEDCKLCEMLSRGYIDGCHLKAVAKKMLDIELIGPRAEWKYPLDRQFGDAYKWFPPKSMVMILDLSDSMNETCGKDDPATKRTQVKLAFASGEPRFKWIPCPFGGCRKCGPDTWSAPRTGYHKLILPEHIKEIPPGRTENVDFGVSNKLSKLATCQESIRGIIQNNCSSGDRVGLVSFANDANVDLPLKEKANKEESMLQKVKALETQGETAFYDGVLKGIRLVCGEGEKDDVDFRLRPKWVVSLTDGTDNMSQKNSFDEAVQLLKTTPQLNFALITVGLEDDTMDQELKRKFKALSEAPKSNSNEGLWLRAADSKAISDAFDKIAEKMKPPPPEDYAV